MASRSLVDIHAHLIVSDVDQRLGFVSKQMAESLSFRLGRLRLGLAAVDLPQLGELYLAELRRQIQGSANVRAVVALALDGVYDASGRLDPSRCHLYVANDAVLELAERESCFLAGASINPLRRDALDELDRVSERGAVLIKWLPNSQLFDPDSAEVEPFYQALVRHRLPLLIHSGAEYSVARSGFQDGGNPERWRRALDHGVNVIAAHGGSSGRFVPGKTAASFLSLIASYPNLYADSSALGLPNRVATLRLLCRHPDAVARLTFGTDFPLPCVPSLLLARLQLRAWLEVRGVRNHFDRQVTFFRHLGWSPNSAVFDRLCRRVP